MSSRHYAQQQRQQMREALLQKYRDGQLRSGEVLPSVRELAKQYDLSIKMAHNVLREMGDEGLVQRKRGAGVYMGHLPEHSTSTFAAVFADKMDFMPHINSAREGFEAEIARRSNPSLTLTPKTDGLNSVLQDIRNGQLELAGAFYVPSYEPKLHEEGEKIVRSLGDIPFIVHDIEPYPKEERLAGLSYDTIRFDDFEGGRQTVRHLLKSGHRRMAFLGLHAQDEQTSQFLWSIRREKGIASALAETDETLLTFCPKVEVSPSHDHSVQQAAGQEAAEKMMPLIRKGEIDAIICVNHTTVTGLMQAFRESNMAASLLPAIIAFDDISKGDHLLSVLRLSWNDMGRYAASALWERVFGTEAQRQAPPHEILVPMRLIARPLGAGKYPTMAVADPIYAGL